MKKVVIVIPVYSEQISENELISLKQLNRILPNYDKKFIAPIGLNTNYADFCSSWDVDYYNQKYFSGTISYSDVMLSASFYQKYIEYEYMFIHQLDVFVFKDRLEEFCNYSYDYIGGPWPMNHRYSIGRKNAKVGNGGASLRKISSTIRVLENKQHIFEKYALEEMFQNVEDYFFTFCGGCKEIDFSVPSVGLGREFAIDFPTDAIYFQKIKSLNSFKLPFCFHGWNKNGCISTTKKYIENYGYEVVDDNLLYDYEKMRITYMSLFVVDKWIKNDIEILRDVLKCNYNFINKTIIIWGGGTFGQKVLEISEKCKIRLHCVYDQRLNKIKESNVCVKKADYDEICSKKYFIIITPFAYENQIASELEASGLKKDNDYILYSDIAREIISRYVEKCVKKIKKTMV